MILAKVRTAKVGATILPTMKCNASSSSDGVELMTENHFNDDVTAIDVSLIALAR